MAFAADARALVLIRPAALIEPCRAIMASWPRPTSWAAIGPAPRPWPSVDLRGTWTYGMLADYVARFGQPPARPRGTARGARPALPPRRHRLVGPLSGRPSRPAVVPIPVNTSPRTITVMADSRDKVLVVSEEFTPGKFARLIEACPDLAQVVVAGGDAHGHTALRGPVAGAGFEVEYGAHHRRRHLLRPYTSGRPRRRARPCTSQPAPHGRPLWRPTGRPARATSPGLVAKLFFAYGLGNALTFP